MLQPTSFCNLDCTYCYLPHRDRRNHMTVEVASAVADSLAEFAGRDPDRPLDVVWHAGEPLTLGVRRFAELLAPFEPLRRAGLVHHYVQTNATLVTDAWCDFLTAHRFRVGVSIDGPATLNAQRIDRRGKAAFDRIVKGIARLRAAGIAFSVIAVVTTDSIGHPEELLEFLAGLGCHSIGINIEEAEGIITRTADGSACTSTTGTSCRTARSTGAGDDSASTSARAPGTSCSAMSTSRPSVAPSTTTTNVSTRTPTIFEATSPATSRCDVSASASHPARATSPRPSSCHTTAPPRTSRSRPPRRSGSADGPEESCRA
ncbi:radical SAM protein [Kitasatospora sp. NPDC048538]|uniref:radical SAM protein n=1 Tax=unclassified Kitasatospora TaxID=2633591 RepID=UPI0033ED6501